jgi:hypothetical protein
VAFREIAMSISNRRDTQAAKKPSGSIFERFKLRR